MNLCLLNELVPTGGWSDFKVYILAITLPADMLCNKYMDM